MSRLLVIVRCFLGFVVSFLVLEVCARVGDTLSYDAPFWGPYNDQVLYVRDKIGKWGKPGARYKKWQLCSYYHLTAKGLRTFYSKRCQWGYR
jgi:hypothetical protein